MPKLFIHIGTHKTGSSAIRTALEEDAVQLEKKENIVRLALFPDARTLRSIKAYNAELVASGRDYFRKMIGVHDSDARLVMSYEGFSGEPLWGYGNASIIAPMLRAMTEGFDTSIIVYLRRQDSFIESFYTERVHKGNELGSFQDFLSKIDTQSFDWRRLLDNFSAAFDKDRLIVRRYDKQFLPEPHSLLHSFADIIGSSVLKKKSRYGVNAGYSEKASEVARSLNPHLSYKEKKKLQFILQSTSAKKPLEEYPYFEASERDRLLRNYADQNALVAREYLNDASGKLFSAPETSVHGESAGKTIVPGRNRSSARASFYQLSVQSGLLLISRQVRRIARGMVRRFARIGIILIPLLNPGIEDDVYRVEPRHTPISGGLQIVLAEDCEFRRKKFAWAMAVNL